MSPTRRDPGTLASQQFVRGAIMGLEAAQPAAPSVVVQGPIDRPTLGGANASNFGVTTSTTAATMIAAPAANTYFNVGLVTLFNPHSGAAPIVYFQVNVNGTARIVHATPALATKTSSDWQPIGLILLPTESLEVKCDSAPGAELVWSAHWATPAR